MVKKSKKVDNPAKKSAAKKSAAKKSAAKKDKPAKKSAAKKDKPAKKSRKVGKRSEWLPKNAVKKIAKKKANVNLFGTPIYDSIVVSMKGFVQDLGKLMKKMTDHRGKSVIKEKDFNIIQIEAEKGNLGKTALPPKENGKRPYIIPFTSVKKVLKDATGSQISAAVVEKSTALVVKVIAQRLQGARKIAENQKRKKPTEKDLELIPTPKLGIWA